MKKIMFSDKYGLTEAVLSGRKTMTRRMVNTPRDMTYDFCNPIMGIDDKGKLYFTVDYCDGSRRDIYPQYQIGEKLAVAQSYWDLRNNDGFYEALHRSDPSFPLECIRGEKGCHNKMFVRADWMPIRIRITDIKVERLQDISEADIMREGIHEGEFMNTWDKYYFDECGDVPNHITFKTPRLAFQSLIDKVCKRGTWKRNPWVYAYTFEMVR